MRSCKARLEMAKAGACVLTRRPMIDFKEGIEALHQSNASK